MRAQAAWEGPSERRRHQPLALGSSRVQSGGGGRLWGGGSAAPRCLSSPQLELLGAPVSLRQVDIETNKKNEGPRHLAGKMSSVELFCSRRPSRSEQ